MMRNLFSVISNRTAPKKTTTPDRLVYDAIKTYLDAQNIFPRSVTDPAPTPAAENLEKYGMCEVYLEQYMVMCVMKLGQ